MHYHVHPAITTIHVLRTIGFQLAEAGGIREAPPQSSHCRFAAQCDTRLTQHPGCFRATKCSNIPETADGRGKGLLYPSSKCFLWNCGSPAAAHQNVLTHSQGSSFGWEMLCPGSVNAAGWQSSGSTIQVFAWRWSQAETVMVWGVMEGTSRFRSKLRSCWACTASCLTFSSTSGSWGAAGKQTPAPTNRAWGGEGNGGRGWERWGVRKLAACLGPTSSLGSNQWAQSHCCLNWVHAASSPKWKEDMSPAFAALLSLVSEEGQ